jgi:Cu/Ag efflux protein CusF
MKEAVMKKVLAFCLVVVFTLSLAGMAFAAGKAATSEKQPSGKKERVVTATATVEAIDLQKRTVKLKGEKGNVFDITVSEEARNLPQVKVGDLVVVKYYESVAYRLLKPGEAAPGTQETETIARAKPGEKPAGVVGREVTITATIQAIDKKKQTVTLKGPDGKTVTVKAEKPKNLEKVKVGDEVEITYTEALAISVEKAKK